MTEAVKSLVYKLTDTFQVGIANLDGIDSSAPVELMRSITGVVSASLNGQLLTVKYSPLSVSEEMLSSVLRAQGYELQLMEPNEAEGPGDRARCGADRRRQARQHGGLLSGGDGLSGAGRGRRAGADPGPLGRAVGTAQWAVPLYPGAAAGFGDCRAAPAPYSFRHLSH